MAFPLSQTRSRQCSQDTRDHDLDSRGYVLRDHFSGAPIRRGPARSGSSELSDRCLTNRPTGFRGHQRGLLLHSVRDHGDPGAGGQHLVFRLPPARLLPGARLLHPEAIHLSRRPAGLHRRGRHAGIDVLHRALHLRRRNGTADPTLRLRRLPLVHHLAIVHVRALGPQARERAGISDWVSTRSARP